MTTKLQDLADGARLRFAGYEWIALDYGNAESVYSIDGYARICLMADTLKNAPFDVNNCNDWRASTARAYLNGEFLDGLTLNRVRERQPTRTQLLEYISDLTADDGLKDYGTCSDLVFLLSGDDYRRNRYDIRNTTGWWWLITPHTTPNSTRPSIVCLVGTDGTLAGSNACVNNYGLRPAIYLSGDTEVEVCGD
jgi:hypothetical protein